jgi:hypothetical protein
LVGAIGLQPVVPAKAALKQVITFDSIDVSFPPLIYEDASERMKIASAETISAKTANRFAYGRSRAPHD